MNIATQYGAGLRTGILIGAGTCALSVETNGGLRRCPSFARSDGP